MLYACEEEYIHARADSYFLNTSKQSRLVSSHLRLRAEQPYEKVWPLGRLMPQYQCFKINLCDHLIQKCTFLYRYYHAHGPFACAGIIYSCPVHQRRGFYTYFEYHNNLHEDLFYSCHWMHSKASSHIEKALENPAIPEMLAESEIRFLASSTLTPYCIIWMTAVPPNDETVLKSEDQYKQCGQGQGAHYWHNCTNRGNQLFRV